MMSVYHVDLGPLQAIEVQYRLAGFPRTIYYCDGDEIVVLPNGFTRNGHNGLINQAANRRVVGPHILAAILSKVQAQ